MGQVKRCLDLAGDISGFGHPVATQHLPSGQTVTVTPALAYSCNRDNVSTNSSTRKSSSNAVLYCQKAKMTSSSRVATLNRIMSLRHIAAYKRKPLASIYEWRSSEFRRAFGEASGKRNKTVLSFCYMDMPSNNFFLICEAR